MQWVRTVYCNLLELKHFKENDRYIISQKQIAMIKSNPPDWFNVQHFHVHAM